MVIRGLRFFMPLAAFVLIVSCRTADFYSQAVGGQFEILRKSRPSDQVIADPSTPEELRRQLKRVEEIRSFAAEHLSLPGYQSYGRYADLGRDSVTWVLYAAPEFSLAPKTWWYPRVGRLDYRGFFRKDAAERQAAELENEGLDVIVAGVDAYSTLGWFHDPVLNTFVHYHEIILAELIFHELTHRRLFRPGETSFNESLATAYSEEGVRRWLRHHGRLDELRDYEVLLACRARFYQKVDHTRHLLEKLYAESRPDAEKRTIKKQTLAALQDELRGLRRRWGGRGLESWLTQPLNNAHLVSIITYQEHTALFDQLFASCGGDPECFFRRAAALEIPAAQSKSRPRH